jgi:hypothetical protein
MTMTGEKGEVQMLIATSKWIVKHSISGGDENVTSHVISHLSFEGRVLDHETAISTINLDVAVQSCPCPQQAANE